MTPDVQKEETKMKLRTLRTGERSKWAWLAVCALTACALVLAACGGGSSSSGNETTAEGTTAEGTSTAGGGSGEKKATGEPIVTWTYTDVNTEGLSYKNVEESVHVYQEWINSHGGIAGRPLEANFCDSRGTATAAAACAREAVGDHAVASVSSFSFTGDAVVPILEAGHTAQLGCCDVAPSEFSSNINFQFGNQPLYLSGLVVRAAQDGCKQLPVVLVEGSEVFEPLIETAAQSEGAKIEKFVVLPATPQDYSPQVAEATSGNPDCVLTFFGETNWPAWLTAFQQSGSEAKMYGTQGNFNEIVVNGFEELVEGDVVAGMFPDISTEAWSEYREALQQYEADPSLDYNSLGGMGTWAAFEVFKQIVESMPGEINNETFLKAAATAKVDLPGMLPPLDFAHKWGEDGGPKGFERMVDRCAVYSEFGAGGKLVPSSTEFTDLSEASGGTKPMDCGPPFGT
jgi:ABC-type branched-subunit amino acid transport system substrate-binding protein